MKSSTTQVMDAVKKGAVNVWLSALVVLLTSLPLTAQAATDVTTDNSQTGSNSNQTTDVNQNNDLDFSVNNDANATNNFRITANTGNITISRNTKVGNITTGDVTFDLSAKNDLNNNATTGLGGASVAGLNDSSTNVSTSNFKTGANSSSTTNVSSNNSTSINHHNSGSVTNTFALSASTGGVKVADNTKVGDITTGSINIGLNVENNVNSKPGLGGSAKPPVVVAVGPVNPATKATPVAVISTPQQSTPVGGSFFPAGSNAQPYLILYLLVLLSSGALFLQPELKKLVVTKS